MGYVAFVADMYGEGRVTREAGEAANLSGAAQQAGLAKLAEPALAELRKLEQVDGSKIAAIGFCFGGSTVADMVRSGLEIKAGVSFHGTLGPALAPAAGSGVETPLMVLHGGADPMVAPEAVAGFVQKCIEAGVPISFVNFPAAVHAFSNPDADQAGIEGVSYDEQAAKAGWRLMAQFLAMTIGAEARDPNSLHGLQYDGADQPEEAPD
jgi:dienelactone hydrolase